MTGTEFMEKNLNGCRPQLYRKLWQGVFQTDNTAVIETETLRYMTQAEIELAEKAMRE